MRKPNRIGLFLLLAMLLLVLSKPFSVFLFQMTPLWQGQNEMEKDFITNKEQIYLINNYLVESTYDSLFINDLSEGSAFSGLERGDIPIDSTEVVDAMKQLRKRGYSVIRKRGNCVSFIRWRNKDNARGVVYSIDGHTPNESSIQYLTKLEPIKESGWYYYEADYNEWRVNVELHNINW